MTVKSRGAILAAALIGGLVLLWWFLRRDSADLGDEPKPGDDLPEDLTRLPNFRPAADSKISFANHDEFVRRLDEAFFTRFPSRAARGLLIAHAATAGWHTQGRVPLYHWNLWGQLATKEQIRNGVSFTLLRARLAGGELGKFHAFRAFSSPQEALMEGYIPNIDKYDTNAVKYLETRDDKLRLEQCVQYATLIKPWFAKKERTPDQLAIKGGKWFWIWGKFIKGKQV